MLNSDFHIHTIMSGHAFCTVNECAANAAQKGIKVICITDHGPSMDHSAHEGYFEMSKRLPKRIGAVSILFGCEANIIDVNGTLDISNKTQNSLDIVLAGLHERTPYQANSDNDNTKSIINAISTNIIHVISHPYRSNFPINVKDVVSVAISNNVLLEVNKQVILNAIADYSNADAKITILQTTEMIDYLQAAGVGYIINSDAHYTDEIGISEEELATMQKYLGIDQDYIYNNKFSELAKYFHLSIFDSIRSKIE
jgi:putative hydrolase